MHQPAQMHGLESIMDQELHALLCKFTSRYYAGFVSDSYPSSKTVAEWSDEKLLAEWIDSDLVPGDPVADALAAEAKSRGWVSGRSKSVRMRDNMRSMAQAIRRRFHRSS